MLEMMIKTMFAIVSMLRINGLEISKKPKWKLCKCNMQRVPNVGNDDLNNVHHS